MPHAQPPTPSDASETLRLDDALKLAGVAATGGEAKTLIQGGAVRVNGAVETRRKRRLVEGDVIEVGDDSFEIALSDDDEDDPDDVLAGERSAARDPDPPPVRAPGAGELEDPGDDEDDDEDDFDDEDDGWEEERIEARLGGNGPATLPTGTLRLDDAELDRWAAWVRDRVADHDTEAAIIRLGSLHPEALEAVFQRLPPDVEERVLDALDEVLERGLADTAGDAPLQA